MTTDLRQEYLRTVRYSGRFKFKEGKLPQNLFVEMQILPVAQSKTTQSVLFKNKCSPAFCPRPLSVL